MQDPWVGGPQGEVAPCCSRSCWAGGLRSSVRTTSRLRGRPKLRCEACFSAPPRPLRVRDERREVGPYPAYQGGRRHQLGSAFSFERASRQHDFRETFFSHQRALSVIKLGRGTLRKEVGSEPPPWPHG